MQHLPEVVLGGGLLLALAGYVGRAYVRWSRPGTLRDDLHADAQRALNDPRRLTR